MKACVKFTCDKFIEDRTDFNSWITVLSTNLNEKRGKNVPRLSWHIKSLSICPHRYPGPAKCKYFSESLKIC